MNEHLIKYINYLIPWSVSQPTYGHSCPLMNSYQVKKQSNVKKHILLKQDDIFSHNTERVLNNENKLG